MDTWIYIIQRFYWSIVGKVGIVDPHPLGLPENADTSSCSQIKGWTADSCRLFSFGWEVKFEPAYGGMVGEMGLG